MSRRAICLPVTSADVDYVHGYPDAALTMPQFPKTRVALYLTPIDFARVAAIHHHPEAANPMLASTDRPELLRRIFRRGLIITEANITNRWGWA